MEVLEWIICCFSTESESISGVSLASCAEVRFSTPDPEGCLGITGEEIVSVSR